MIKLSLSGPVPKLVDTLLLNRAVKALNILVPQDEVWRANVEFVDDAKISALNKKYSAAAEPTDVLSFSYQEEGFKVDGELGDIALNLEAAMRQAASYQVPVEHEVVLLVIHGLLHLLGFDHGGQVERDEMASMQTKIAVQTGINSREFEWK